MTQGYCCLDFYVCIDIIIKSIGMLGGRGDIE